MESDNIDPQCVWLTWSVEDGSNLFVGGGRLQEHDCLCCCVLRIVVKKGSLRAGRVGGSHPLCTPLAGTPAGTSERAGAQ